MDKYKTELPVVNQNGYYEIRLESIGGLGANLCGKLLGELGAEYLGLNSASFSEYGSEKRGSPVKAFVRWSEGEILHNSPIENPNMLLLFHEALARAYPVTAGVDENCAVVVNTSSSPRQAREFLPLHGGKVCCVNALEIALQTKSRVNMVMLGAAVKASGFIPLDGVIDLVTRTIGEKYPQMLESNINGINQGYEKAKQEFFPAEDQYSFIPFAEKKILWGYENAPLGGENPHFGSTVTNDLSPSREGYIPLFLYEKCIHCGLCDTTCPDMVFQFISGEFKGKPSPVNRGLDYRHCKGCLRCVDVCPTGALVAGKEADHPKKRWHVRNKDLIAQNIAFEYVGADPWITSEAYLDEKRVDGGLM